ncbi:DUF262 domain-containing protein [Nitrosococcus wardiae]|uniref:DUF262 domain-containing protein n=1 Tax=Nitrosococcus wardiae TaxID=1814290 RepID=A0A4P7C3B2_9GAMM|nr:DUF262 domain-containing protein [Nitrosococcus wardiae]QBQ56220.1 DUF262 domain-containing protein [Nitrosococcus wardiae]
MPFSAYPSAHSATFFDREERRTNPPPAKTPMTASVEVSVQRFTALFENATLPLAIDSYQRPFVWETNKIAQLVTDLRDYSRERQENPSLEYYMGTVLLHRNRKEGRLFVIDGQQRLTALSVLHHVLRGELPPHHALRYGSFQSVTHIQRAQAYLADADLNALVRDVFERICFTVIVVASEDLAFTFFDTQNHRGVPLNATDLLKAYHLRAIPGEHSRTERLQEDCAGRWERLQRTPPILGHGADFAPTLFHEFLWRARRWTGQKLIAHESYEDILQEFQEDTLPPETPEQVPLYPTRYNCLGAALAVTPQGELRLLPHSLALTTHPAELPFALRQPISKGLGFFLYADKYTRMLTQLLKEEDHPAEVQAFRKLYEAVIAHLSLYLRELFLLASVMYVDQFGYRQLLHFALWLEHVLGAIRFEKRAIFAQAPLIYLRDNPLNLLDVIASAFRPEQVIDYLKADPPTIYEREEVEDINPGEGVRGRYKERVLEYYGRQGSLKGKATWITEDFIREQLS